MYDTLNPDSNYKRSIEMYLPYFSDEFPVNMQIARHKPLIYL